MLDLMMTEFSYVVAGKAHTSRSDSIGQLQTRAGEWNLLMIRISGIELLEHL